LRENWRKTTFFHFFLISHFRSVFKFVVINHHFTSFNTSTPILNLAHQHSTTQHAKSDCWSKLWKVEDGLMMAELITHHHWFNDFVNSHCAVMWQSDDQSTVWSEFETSDGLRGGESWGSGEGIVGFYVGRINVVVSTTNHKRYGLGYEIKTTTHSKKDRNVQNFTTFNLLPQFKPPRQNAHPNHPTPTPSQPINTTPPPTPSPQPRRKVVAICTGSKFGLGYNKLDWVGVVSDKLDNASWGLVEVGTETGKRKNPKEEEKSGNFVDAVVDWDMAQSDWNVIDSIQCQYESMMCRHEMWWRKESGVGEARLTWSGWTC